MSDISAKIINACEKYWDQYQSDCSGFVKAVANEVGIVLSGQANDIVDQIQQIPWKSLATGYEASINAEVGLVIAGLKANPNGHVAVVVPGDLAHAKYPVGYWGRLGGGGRKNTTLNWSWNKTDRDKVFYALKTL